MVIHSLPPQLLQARADGHFQQRALPAAFQAWRRLWRWRQQQRALEARAACFHRYPARLFSGHVSRVQVCCCPCSPLFRFSACWHRRPGFFLDFEHCRLTELVCPEETARVSPGETFAHLCTSASRTALVLYPFPHHEPR